MTTHQTTQTIINDRKAHSDFLKKNGLIDLIYALPSGGFVTHDGNWQGDDIKELARRKYGTGTLRFIRQEFYNNGIPEESGIMRVYGISK